MRERTKLEVGIKEVDDLFGDLQDNTDLIELAEAEDDADVMAEADEAMAELLVRAQKAQLKTLLSGEADANDCYIQVQAGAGGTEAQDWAEMLLRMYSRWGRGEIILDTPKDQPYEATLLHLNIDKARMKLGWSPKWHVNRSIEECAIWYKEVLGGANARDVSLRQIDAYMSDE